ILRSPKLDELIDKQKNWIFDTPTSFDREKAVEEIFGVHKYELDNLDKKPKNAMERYFEAGKGNTGSSKSHSPDDRINNRDGFAQSSDGDSNARPWLREDAHSPDPGGIIPELNPAPLFNNSVLPAETIPQLGNPFGQNSALPKGLGDPVFGRN